MSQQSSAIRVRREPDTAASAVPAAAHAATPVAAQQRRVVRPWLLAIAYFALPLLGARSRWYTAGSEVGYWLGVAGAAAMFALLLYPVRKRLEGRIRLGALRYWFAGHMLLGVIGPWLILMHCQLRIGSLNAAIAFWSMVVVASSGVVGRFLYAQLHAGLYGRLRSVADLQLEASRAIDEAAPWLRGQAGIERELTAFTERAARVRSAGLRRPWAVAALGWQARSALQRCTRALRTESGAAVPANDRARGVESLLGLYIAASLRAARYATVERLFSLWHVLHIPLVLILFATVVVHVIAVHMY